MATQHNILTINSYRNLGINQSALDKSLEKLSSGYKISRAGDNAAGLATSGSVKPQINGLNQASTNAKDTIDLTRVAGGTLSEVHSMLQRMTTLAEQVASGAYSIVTRGNIQEEHKALTKEIKCISEDASFNGIKPLTTGRGMMMTFQIGPTSSETIVVGKKDIYDKIVTAAMSLKLSVQNDVRDAPETIKTAIDGVLTYRVKLGVAQNRLEHTVESLDTMSENITEAENRIRDTDMAGEITAFMEDNILLQAVQSMLAQPNATPQGILSLLQ